MVAGFLLVESGLWLGGRLMRSHLDAAGVERRIIRKKKNCTAETRSTFINQELFPLRPRCLRGDISGLLSTEWFMYLGHTP